MAEDTGGQVYEATTTDNLRTVYQQRADILFNDAYILTYISGLGAGGPDAALTIQANDPPANPGDDTKIITPCP